MKELLNEYSILSCPVQPFKNEKEVLDSIQRMVQEGIGGYSVAINAEKIHMYRSNSELREIIDKSVLKVPDGAGAVLGLKFMHKVKSIRVDLPKLSLQAANQNSLKVFVLGASKESNVISQKRIIEIYANIRAVDGINGYFDSIDSVKKQIKTFDPDIIMVAMGSPRQEITSRQLLDSMPDKLFINCGGAIDIIAGVTTRAPAFYQNNHLEWFYRLVKQPSRFKRQLRLPVFLWRLLFASSKKKLGK